MKSKKLKIFGMQLEIIGLSILLIGAFWQAKVSGWWDRQLPEWQAFIQEEINLTVLMTLNDIANIGVSNDAKEKKFLKESIKENIDRTYIRTISERDQREKTMKSGQASVFWSIRDFFMIAGAFLIVLGKIVSLKGIKSEE